jgi:RecB family endonuclease NucS
MAASSRSKCGPGAWIRSSTIAHAPDAPDAPARLTQAHQDRTSLLHAHRNVEIVTWVRSGAAYLVADHGRLDVGEVRLAPRDGVTIRIVVSLILGAVSLPVIAFVLIALSLGSTV